MANKNVGMMLKFSFEKRKLRLPESTSKLKSSIVPRPSSLESVGRLNVLEIAVLAVSVKIGPTATPLRSVV